MSSQPSITPPVPVSAPPPAPRDPHTAARTFLRDLNIDSVLKANYDPHYLIRRALKVFLMAYPEFGPDVVDNQTYRDKLDQYIQVVEDLYKVKLPNVTALDNIWNQCNDCRIGVFFAVKSFGGRFFRHGHEVFGVCEEPTFFVRCYNDGQVSPSQVINMRSEEQHNCVTALSYTFPEFREVRRQNYHFMVIFKPKTWNSLVLQNPIKDFTIGIAGIHPEGYQQWVDFGRGVILLVEIHWSVTREEHVHSKKAGQFHLQTIYRILENRLTEWRSSAHMCLWHKHRNQYDLVTTMRPPVPPTSDEMFWRTTSRMNMEALKKYSETGVSEHQSGMRVMGAVSRLVNYIDVQRNFTYGEDFLDKVCLCNEWCNWSAFFHHNHPIYRFILVMHNQLFLTERMNVPEMYLLSATALGSGHTPSPRTPLLQLIHWANQFRNSFRFKYMSSPSCRVLVSQYVQCRPSPDRMLGVTYNILRYDFNVVALCHQLDDNPLADICIKNLLNYYEVLSDLHVAFKRNQMMVLHEERHRWNDELDRISRVKVGHFLRESYKKIMTQKYHVKIVDPISQTRIRVKAQYKDTVFGSDMEYLSYVPHTDDQTIIKLTRLRALRSGSSDNVFNCSVKVDRFTHCFISVYKFFSRTEPRLPTAHELESQRDINDYCMLFDEYFTQQHKWFVFVISGRDVHDFGLHQFEYNIHVFYTLKLYSFGFAVQKQCITTRARLLESCDHDIHQFANAFEFIWANNVIEETLQALYNQQLFDIDDIDLMIRFEDFYVDLWGIPDHEVATDYKQFSQYVDSALEEYYKLYFWETNNGHRKAKFTAILKTFETSLRQIVDRSETIHTDSLIPAFIWMCQRYSYTVEVMDVMVVYLVRAVCFTVISKTAQYFKEIHKLQNDKLCRKIFRCFSMAKPGWLELLKKRNRYPSLVVDRLRNFYIVFDDECERIANALTDMVKMIKAFFKNMYLKLTFEFIAEINGLLARVHTLREVEKYSNLAELQVAVGLAFSAAFADEFRYSFYRRRRRLRRIMTSTSPKKIQLRRFFDCLEIVNQYLSLDRSVIRRGKPFICDLWTQHLNQTQPALAQLTAQDVDLDMNEANRV